MSTRKIVFHAGMMLGTCQVLSQSLAFGRNVFIARILTPEDYGLAATFWLTTGLLSTITEFGFQQRLVQSPDGNDRRVGAVAQGLYAIRGLLIGLVLLLSAPFVASVFDAPEATWAFQLLALLPVISGFTHRDVDRVKRELNFKPAVTIKLVPELIVTLAAIPIALATKNYSAFLFIGLLKTVLSVVLSFMLATRPFRFAWDREIIKKFMAFGWPMMVNSLLIFGVLQGDRVVLATAYSKAELGVYSVAIGMVTALLGLAINVINPVMLPLMARSQDDASTFQRHYRLHAQVIGGISLLSGLACLLLGPTVVTLIYGPKYVLAATVVGILGVAQTLRLLRGPAANAAMARGDTQNMMYANLLRQVGLGFTCIAALYRLPLQAIAIGSVVGEICALLATVALLQKRHGLPIAILLRPAAFAGFSFVLAAVVVEIHASSRNCVTSFFEFTVMSGISMLLYLLLFPPVRQELSQVCKLFHWRLFASA